MCSVVVKAFIHSSLRDISRILQFQVLHVAAKLSIRLKKNDAHCQTEVNLELYFEILEISSPSDVFRCCQAKKRYTKKLSKFFFANHVMLSSYFS